MGIEEIKAHLLECGFKQRSKSIFRKDSMEYKFLDNGVCISLITPDNDRVMFVVAEIEFVGLVKVSAE